MSPVEQAFLAGVFVGFCACGLLMGVAVSIVEAWVLRGER